MNPGFHRFFPVTGAAALAAVFFTSCAVDENAALHMGGAGTASETGEAGETRSETDSASGEAPTWAELMERARQRREARAEVREEIETSPQRGEEDPELATPPSVLPWLRSPEQREALEAARETAEELAEERREERRKAREERRRELAERRAEEAADTAGRDRSSRSGFAGLFGGGSRAYRSEGHFVHVNQRIVDGLSPANAKIEIDLSDQRARVYKVGSGGRELAIETQVSTGRSGYTTPTGTWRIKEKKVEKRSTIYGRWVNASGATIASNGNSRYRPAGGARFIGAEMPYWMRVTGGIGMHVGFVPDHPASHGCIRVPAAIQPLIFSKVGVGTSVTIRH